MHTIPIITASLSLIFACIACFLNLYLVVSIFCVKKIKKRSDFILIFGRFFVDIGYTFQTSANLIYLLINIIAPGQNFLKSMKNLLFYLSWPNYLLGSSRALFVFFITLDRVLATCLPIYYHKYRSEIPSKLLFAFIFAYAIWENFVLFWICDYEINVPEECTHLGCSVNKCYHEKYWMNFEQILYFTIGLLSIILSIRLFIWNNFRKTTRNKDLSRANRIALLDTFIIFGLGFLPPVLFSYAPGVNFETVGPLSALCKNMGFVIESVIICNLMVWKSKVEPGSSHRTTS